MGNSLDLRGSANVQRSDDVLEERHFMGTAEKAQGTRTLEQVIATSTRHVLPDAVCPVRNYSAHATIWLEQKLAAFDDDNA